MNFEQYQYTVAGLKAFQTYPYTKMTKRYFKGFRQNNPDKLYRIVAYPQNLVKTEALIARLKAMKEIEHSMLSKIGIIYQETSLVKQGEKPEQVIAVLFEENIQQCYLNLCDFVLKVGTLSEKLTQDLTFNLINFIKFMEEKNFINCFNYNDLLIDKNSGKIIIDNYGDSQFFILKQEVGSSIWQLGSLIFILLKGNPPYSKKAYSDPHYNCLNKGLFQKFWGLIPPKPVLNPPENATNFLNKCFQKQTSYQTLLSSNWLKDFQPLSQQQKATQMASIAALKQQKLTDKLAHQRDKKQKMQQAAREREIHNRVRGTYPQFIQNFLDYLFIEQQKSRPFLQKHITNHEEQQNEKLKIQIAQIITLLGSIQDKDIKIYEIRDKKNSLTFKIKTDVGGSIPIDSEVELQFQLNNKNQVKLSAKKIEGSFFESLWVNNFIHELFLEA